MPFSFYIRTAIVGLVVILFVLTYVRRVRRNDPADPRGR